MKRRGWVFLFVLIVGLVIFKNNLHLLGAEIGSEADEASKKLFQIEALFNHKLITRVDTKHKLVALTFDDGPDPRFTPEVLKILKKYNVRATFFVVGQSCEKYPELLKSEVAAGHEVENHTYTHPDLSRDSALQTEDEILKNEAALKRLAQVEPHYFRPPKRLFTNETVEIAEINGYRTVLWTVCVEHRSCKTVQDLADRVIGKARPGSIILAHDGRLDRSRTVEALPLIIEGYQKQGYRFVTLDELVNSRTKFKSSPD